MKRRGRAALIPILFASLYLGVPWHASAAVAISLSATSGQPGDEIRMTVPNPSVLAVLLPLPVHLHPKVPWPAAACALAGSRFLGLLDRTKDGVVSLTFTVPLVMRGTYYLVAGDRSTTCLQLGAGPAPVEFEVLPRGLVPLPVPELIADIGRIGPVFHGCGSFDINGASGVDDCGPYEYSPVLSAPTRLDPGGWATFGLSPNWKYGEWKLTAIAEGDIPASMDPSEGQVEIATGRGGSRTIHVRVPGASGEYRLFLTYRAMRGTASVNIDRPTVFTVDFRLPDTATAPTPSRELAMGTSSDPMPLVAAAALMAFGIALVTGRRRPTERSTR